MDIQSRKIEFMQAFLKLQSEEIISQLENILREKATIKIEEDLDFKGTETEIKIQQILNDYVRPAVEQDGGAITYRSFDEGIVTVELRGSCSGCPSSTITLKSGIQSLLQRMVPEVKEVVSEAL